MPPPSWSFALVIASWLAVLCAAMTSGLRGFREHQLQTACGLRFGDP
jgi:hypothetical protein